MNTVSTVSISTLRPMGKIIQQGKFPGFAKINQEAQKIISNYQEGMVKGKSVDAASALITLESSKATHNINAGVKQTDEKEYTQTELDEMFKDDPVFRKAQQMLAKMKVKDLLGKNATPEMEKARRFVRSIFHKDQS